MEDEKKYNPDYTTIYVPSDPKNYILKFAIIMWKHPV